MSLGDELRVILELTGLGETGGLDKGETEVEDNESRDQGKTLEDTPSTGELVVLASIDVVAVTADDNDSEDGTDKVTPTLVGEDPAEEETTVLEVRSSETMVADMG